MWSNPANADVQMTEKRSNRRHANDRSMISGAEWLVSGKQSRELHFTMLATRPAKRRKQKGEILEVWRESFITSPTKRQTAMTDSTAVQNSTAQQTQLLAPRPQPEEQKEPPKRETVQEREHRMMRREDRYTDECRQH